MAAKKKLPRMDAAEERRGLVINTAFGLVQGMLWPDESSAAAIREWERKDVQEAAMKAAETFLAEIGK